MLRTCTYFSHREKCLHVEFDRWFWCFFLSFRVTLESTKGVEKLNRWKNSINHPMSHKLRKPKSHHTPILAAEDLEIDFLPRNYNNLKHMSAMIEKPNWMMLKMRLETQRVWMKLQNINETRKFVLWNVKTVMNTICEAHMNIFTPERLQIFDNICWFSVPFHGLFCLELLVWSACDSITIVNCCIAYEKVCFFLFHFHKRFIGCWSTVSLCKGENSLMQQDFSVAQQELWFSCNQNIKLVALSECWANASPNKAFLLACNLNFIFITENQRRYNEMFAAAVACYQLLMLCIFCMWNLFSPSMQFIFFSMFTKSHMNVSFAPLPTSSYIKMIVHHQAKTFPLFHGSCRAFFLI